MIQACKIERAYGHARLSATTAKATWNWILKFHLAVEIDTAQARHTFKARKQLTYNLDLSYASKLLSYWVQIQNLRSKALRTRKAAIYKLA